MNDTNTQDLTIEEDRRIRNFIAMTKQKYLNSPTYLNADWEEELHELDHKCLHWDWWQELTGKWDEESGCAQSYFSLIATELLGVLAGRPGEPDDRWLLANRVLRDIMEDYAITDAEYVSLMELDAEFKEQLRRHINSVPIANLINALVTWMGTLCHTGDGCFSIEVGEESVPVQMVWDRLMNYVRFELA